MHKIFDSTKSSLLTTSSTKSYTFNSKLLAWGPQALLLKQSAIGRRET